MFEYKDGTKNIRVAGFVVVHALNPCKQKQADLCEFEASLIYRASSRTDGVATEKPCLEKQNKIDTLKK